MELSRNGSVDQLPPRDFDNARSADCQLVRRAFGKWLGPTLRAAVALMLTFAWNWPAKAEISLDQASQDQGELNDPAARELRAVRDAEKELLTKQHNASGRAFKPTAKFDIPIDYENESVQDCLSFFQGTGRKFYTNWLSRSTRYVPLFQSILRKWNVPSDLVYVSMIESGFLLDATSTAKAVGPWQFMEETAKQYDLRVNFWIDERRDPEKATHAAARYFSDLFGEFKEWPLAWAAYNTGSKRVADASRANDSTNFWTLANSGKSSLPQETRLYVPRIMAAALIAKHQGAFGFSAKKLSPFKFDAINLRAPVDLGLLAKCAGMKEEELQELNPELLHHVTPPTAGDTYRLRVPRGKLGKVAICSPKASVRAELRGHIVQAGETIRTIASSFRADPMEIVKLNRIAPGNFRINQALVIPITKKP